MTRHEARETAFIVLFEKLFRPDDSIDEIISSAEESEFFEANDYIRNVADKVSEKNLGSILKWYGEEKSK